VGRLTRYEGYAFEARLNTEKAALITIQNDSLIALQNLKQLLNINYKQLIDITPIDSFEIAKVLATDIFTNDFIDTILINHPSIKQAVMDEEVARLGLKIAQSNLYPSLAVGGNISSNYNVDQTNINGQKIPLGRQINDNIGKNVNVSLRIPIFSQMQNSNLIKKEKLNISNARLNLQETQDLIVTNTLQLLNDFNSSRQKYMATLSARDNNILSYSLYEERYKLGQISSLELFTSRNVLNSAVSQYLQAKLELFFRYQLLLLLKSK
jgi:outer membrane protein